MANKFLASIPDEFSLVPFWFWNDDLDEHELRRQISDFKRHGVHGFVIHPRVGLPRDIGWMSERMLSFMHFAVEEARRCGMYVFLCDEGMYPSGSSSGQVVKRNPGHRCRCLAKKELQAGEEPLLSDVQNLVAVVKRHNGQRIAVIDRPVDSYIRGIHYVGEGPAEDEPPAADILNPDAVASFINLVYERYAEVLGNHFGKTILAIFTDEPGPLAKCREKGVVPGTTGILRYVNEFLGYDFTPHLPALWYNDEQDTVHYRSEYNLAISMRLEETYYRQIYSWCDAHGIALAGHPAKADDIGSMRYFHIPGQDLVWRWVLPNTPSALEGPESTQAKCTSSAMVHFKRRRNSNECFGAYGHELTWEEMKWLVDWCFVRGVNMLFPHAFYYSVRGCRKDDRPPDVGPNSKWWNEYKLFADYCKRMCWLNTDCEHVCHVAILGESNHLPWSSAKVCFQNQRDFNYLEMRQLQTDAELKPEGIRIAGMQYKVLIIDNIRRIPPTAQTAIDTLCNWGRVIVWDEKESRLCFRNVVVANTPEELISAIDKLAPKDITIIPNHKDVRYRHLIKDGDHIYIICNEGIESINIRIEVPVKGIRTWIDMLKCEEIEITGESRLFLKPYTTMVMRIRTMENEPV